MLYPDVEVSTESEFQDLSTIQILYYEFYKYLNVNIHFYFKFWLFMQ